MKIKVKHCPHCSGKGGRHDGVDFVYCDQCDGTGHLVEVQK